MGSLNTALAIAAAGCAASAVGSGEARPEQESQAEGALNVTAGDGEACGGIAGTACAEGLYCAYPAESGCGAGDRAGVCAKKPGACIQIYDPVCGCDGRTYGSACAAASAGMSVARKGECPQRISQLGETCGGFVIGPAPVCAKGLFCSYAPGDYCGFADAPGTCAAIPTSCSQEQVPVCACDGQTYMNACQAARNRVGILHEGACTGPSGG